MKRSLGWLIWIVTTVTPVVAADAPSLTFHVQLVRGTDDASPPTKESKAIGPKLAAEFHGVFKFKRFWQVQYREVRLAPGKKIKVRMSPEREVEIELTPPGQRAVTAYSHGKAVTRSLDRVDAPMTLIGGERDGQSVWFIAVRRDKPTTD